MRVNVDESAYNDPRFRRLDRLLGCHIDDAIGRTVGRCDTLGAVP